MQRAGRGNDPFPFRFLFSSASCRLVSDHSTPSDMIGKEIVTFYPFLVLDDLDFPGHSLEEFFDLHVAFGLLVHLLEHVAK